MGRWRLTAGTIWQNRDFLRLWTGETISAFGSQVTVLALPLAAVLTLDASPTQMGFLEAAGFAPYLIVTLFAGVWADRVRRRPLLIGTNLGQGLLLALVPLGGWLGLLRIEYLYAVAFAAGVLQVIFQVAYQAYLPTLVAREQLLDANSKLQLSISAASVAGPGLAGLLVEWLTAPLAILVDAASFLAAGLSALAIRRPEPAPRPAAGTAGSHVLRDIVLGLRFVLTNRYLRAMLGEAATFNLFGTGIGALYVLWAARELGIRPGLLGALYAIGSGGSLLGALAAGPLARRFGVGPAMAATYVVACTAPLLVPLARGPMPVVLAALGAWLVLSGISVTMSNIQVISLRQALIPAHLFGRTNAAYRFFISSAAPIGGAAAGLLGDAIGLRPALTLFCAGTVLALPWVLLSPLPRLRTLPDTPAAPPAPVPAADTATGAP